MKSTERKFNLVDILFFSIPGILSIALFWIVLTEENFFLFKENSLKFLKDNSYSIQLSQDWVSLKDLPKGAEEVLISTEDKRFYSHKGYSPFDIHSVLLSNLIFNKKLRGASTITQQLARTLFLNREMSFRRKLHEIHIAVALERTMHKKEILEYYLNSVYWGKGFHGIYYASKFHYGKPANKLNLQEFTHLVNILKHPDSKFNRM
jgi:monofunctional glycosyltransferase